MKTIADLNALIPVLVDNLSRNDHNIGEAYYERYSDDWGVCEQAASNSLYYDEDGWVIDIAYVCCGDWQNDPGDYWTPPSSVLKSAWGRVTDISASHYDEDTDEETVFTEDELAELRSALDKVLEKL